MLIPRGKKQGTIIIKWKQSQYPAVKVKSFTAIYIWDSWSSGFQQMQAAPFLHPCLLKHSLSHRLRWAPLSSCCCPGWSAHGLGTSDMLMSSLHLRPHLYQWPLFLYWDTTTVPHGAKAQPLPDLFSPGASIANKVAPSPLASPGLF